VRQSQASKDVKTEVEEATALKVITRRQPAKTQQTEKISYATIIIIIIIIIIITHGAEPFLRSR
jgi:cell division protein FtsL